jgi:predicted DNA-binding ribbon-helix-helix protein
MKSTTIKKHSVVVGGRKTSITLEDEFLRCLRNIAMERGHKLSKLIADINKGRQAANLSSAIRMFVLRYYRGQLDQWGGMASSLEFSNERETQLGFNFDRD